MNSFLDMINERELKIKKVSSQEYLDWLVEFTNKYNHWCDDTWLYNKNDINEVDYDNTILLSYFQSYINSIASKQNIFESLGNNGDEFSFYFKAKNNFYRIETICGQGSFTIITKLDNIDDNIDIVYLDEEMDEKLIQERELVQYIIINKDLIGQIDCSKFGVHIGHACTIVAMEEGNTDKFKRWYKNGKLQKKIVLTAPLKKLEKLEKDFYSVRDLGFTEVENGTLIAVSLGVMTRKEAKPYIKRLQLWKDS